MVTLDGLYRWNLKEGIQERFWKGGESNHYLPAVDFRHMLHDKEGIYWIATREGLLRWDKANATTRLFTTDDGLPNNVLNAVFEDDFGFLWVSSENGIIQFQKSTAKVKNYRSADGIAHPEFNRISHYQDEEGNIYFGSMNGVTYFHPRDFVALFNQPVDIPLVLTECTIFSGKEGQQIDHYAEVYKSGEITLTPDDRYLTLQFGLLDYDDSNPSQYFYEIDGEQWKVSNDNTLSLSLIHI